jgi:DNA-binding winged helix-turn-helix (wHTH) protein/Tfp pilus assembly protein PilF/TolB-like protein
LTRDNVTVQVPPKAFDVLLTLLRSHGKLVHKQQLIESVWPDVIVEETSLTRAISDLRRALGQSGDVTYIETVPKFGYRFAAPVSIEIPEPPELPTHPPPANRPGRRTVVYLGALCAMVAILASAIFFRSRPPRNSIGTLVVLPFKVLGQVKGETRLLEVGLADALAGRLGSLPGLIVRPVSSVTARVPVSQNPSAIGRQLNADGVVEADVQILDGKARATVRLLNTADDRQLWFDTVESPSANMFSLEDSIAQGIAQRLALHFAPDRLALRKGVPEQEELYARGRAFWMRRDLPGFERALSLFEEALRNDPSFAEAHAGLADCYVLMGLYNHRPVDQMLRLARREVAEALRLDPDLAPAHATSALITQNLERDWKRAESEYRHSIELAPNSAQAHHWFAEFLSIHGRFQESALEFSKALELDPISSIIRSDEAQMWYFAGDTARSLAILDKVELMDPGFDVARDYHARIHMVRQEEDKAWRVVESMNSCNEDCRRKWTAWLPRRDPSAARDAIEWLESESRRRPIPRWTLAIAYTRQGRTDRALDILESMIEKLESGTITMKVEPALDPLRSQPRFRSLLAKLSLL